MVILVTNKKINVEVIIKGALLKKCELSRHLLILFKKIRGVGVPYFMGTLKPFIVQSKTFYVGQFKAIIHASLI